MTSNAAGASLTTWVSLNAHVKYIGALGNTHCAHAPGAMEPLQSAMKYFAEDFERHISGKRCPYCDTGED